MLKNLLPTLATFVVLATASISQAADPGAMDSFKAAHQHVIELVDDKSPDATLEEAVDKFLDYDWLTQEALGGPANYKEKCAERCDEFKELLTKLIRRNYLKRINGKDRGTVVYIKEHTRPTATKVDTLVTFVDDVGNPQTLEIDYVMHKVDGKWLVRDILTSSVSLARNYKHDFTKLHRQGGIDKVIEQLQSKLAEVAQADTTKK